MFQESHTSLSPLSFLSLKLGIGKNKNKSRALIEKQLPHSLFPCVNRNKSSQDPEQRNKDTDAQGSSTISNGVGTFEQTSTFAGLHLSGYLEMTSGGQRKGRK